MAAIEKSSLLLLLLMIYGELTQKLWTKTLAL